MTSEDHRIVVYPDRGKLLGYVLLYLATIVPCVLVGIWWLSDVLQASVPMNPAQAVLAIVNLSVLVILDVLVWLIAPLLAVLLVCTIYRAAIRKPSVIVNAEGIIDHCSLIAGGLGLLRWDEIEALTVYAYNKRIKYMCVMTRDRRVPDNPLVWLFRRSITLTLLEGANLPQWLLSMPVSELAAQIEQHYHATLAANEIGILDWLRASET